MMQLISNRQEAEIMRNFVFGVSDSLVSTIGLVSGVAFAGVSQSTIILTGSVLILVEAFSMAAGSAMSDHSAREVETHQNPHWTRSIGGAVVMFGSYVLAGIAVLAPYLLLPVWPAFFVAIVLSLTMLGLLGWFSAYIAQTRRWPEMIQTILIGGSAIGLGIVVGWFFR